MPLKSPVERYQALLAAARCFGRSMDLRSLIDEILRRAQDVMLAEACSVLLPDPHTGELILYSTDTQIANLPEPLRVPPGAGIAGAAFQSKKIINVANAAEDPRHYSAVARQLGMRTRAILTVPLLDGASCLGVMQALNPRERDCFDAQDE
jgi:phosphoserine phosphatase RsbU/P